MSNQPRNPATVEALADDFVQRHRQGEEPSVEEYADAHPDLADEIRDVFPALLMMEDVKEGAFDMTGVFEGGETDDGRHIEHLGDYRIMRELGRGGMGVVYEAEQESLGRRVAVKVLQSGALADPKQLSRFEMEARSAARLHHTNIVPVFGVGEHDGMHYYVMQYIQGQGLDDVLVELKRIRRIGNASETLELQEVDTSEDQDRIRRDQSEASQVAMGMLTGQFTVNNLTMIGDFNATSGVETQGPGNEPASPSAPPPAASVNDQPVETDLGFWNTVASMAVQVADALGYAHEQGILHRDIKPANLLLDLQGVVWVTDFGLAKAIEGDGLTQTGDVLGTLRYMAPETFKGRSDARSDIFALGLTMYELVAARPAYDAESKNELVQQVAGCHITPIRRLAPGISRDLETIITKCLERDPKHRYRSALALRDDIKRYLSDEPIRARRISVVERMARWCKRNPVVASLSAVVSLLLVVITVGASLFAANQSRSLAEMKELRDKAESARDVAEQLRDAALSAQKDSEDARADANRASKKAVAASKQSLKQLVDSQINSAMSSLDNDKTISALPWLARAVNDEADDARQNLHRIRFEQLVGQVPRPMRMIFTDDSITVARFSRDGSQIHLAGGQPDAQDAPGWLRTWDIQSGKPTGAPNQTVQSVQRLAETHSQRLLATASGNQGWRKPPGEVSRGGIRLWEAAAGSPASQPLELEGSVLRVEFSPNDKLVAAADNLGHVRVWNTIDGSAATPMLSHRDMVTGLAFSPDGKHLLTSSHDGEAITWDIATGKRLATLEHSARLRFAVYLPDGTGIVTVCWDNIIRLWPATSTSDPQPRELFRYETFPVSFTVSPDSRYVVVGEYSGEVLLFDFDSGVLRATQIRHDKMVHTVSFTSDSRLLLTTSADQTARVWDLASGESATPPLPHGTSVTFGSFAPDNRHLVTLARNATVARIWDLASANSGDSVVEVEENLQFLRTSRSQQHVAAAGANTLLIWHGRGIDKQPRSIRLAGTVSGLAVSDDGSLVASAVVVDGKGLVQIWQSENGKQVPGDWKHVAPIEAITFSGDGKRLVSGSQDGAARVWDVTSGQAVTPPLLHQWRVRAVDINHDGSRVVTGTHALNDDVEDDSSEAIAFRGEISLWDVSNGRLLAPSRKFPVPVNTVRFNPDATLIVSASDTGIFSSSDRHSSRIWDGTSLAPISEPFAHPGGVRDAAFSPDGSRVATVGIDGVCRIWDARGIEPLTKPMRHSHLVVKSVAWSGDSKRLLTIDRSGHSQVWDAASGQVLVPSVTPPTQPNDLVLDPSTGDIIRLEEGGRLRTTSVATTLTTYEIQALSAVISGQVVDNTSGLVRVDATALRDGFERLRSSRPELFETSRFQLQNWLSTQTDLAMTSRHWSSARDMLDRLITMAPESADYRIRRATCLVRLRQFKQAAEDQEQAANLLSDDGLTRAAHVMLLAQNGESEKARSQVDVLLQHLKNDSRRFPIRLVLPLLMSAELADKQTAEEMIQVADKLIARQAKNNGLLWFKGMALFRAGRHDEALATFAVLKSKSPFPPILVTADCAAALIQMKKGQASLARSLFKDASTTWASFMEARNTSRWQPHWMMLLMGEMMLTETADALGEAPPDFTTTSQKR